MNAKQVLLDADNEAAAMLASQRLGYPSTIEKIRYVMPSVRDFNSIKGGNVTKKGNKK